MDFGKKIFTSLLFVVLISSNLARNLEKNHELADKTLQCNDEESKNLLKTLRNVEKIKTPVDEKVLIVLTDSEDIYEPLKNELFNKNAIFLPLYMTFRTNITDIYRNVLFLETAKYVKFLIHANSAEKITDIFKHFISVFKNVSDIYNSVGIALTLNNNEQKENVVAKLYNAAKKMNNSDEILKFVDRYLLNENGPPIAVFNKQSSNNDKVDTFLQDIYYSSRNEDHDNFKFNLEDHFQTMINCATELVQRKVMIDVENFLEERLKSYFASLEQPIKDGLNEEEATKIAKNYNYLLRLSNLLSNVKNPESFLENIQATFKCTRFEETFKETYFLPQNIEAIQFLYMTSDDTFASALKEWTKPLKNIKLLNPENLKQWYQKEEGGFLFSRNFESNCVVLSKGKKLQVRGRIIRLSEIDTQQCGRRTTFLEIFAMEKIFIDVDLDLLGREIQLAIIAPVWEVIGQVEINLNGTNGEDLKEMAANGNKTGNKNGFDGLAGLPGGPAGSFYGVANEIINGDQLTILAIGGNGGKGQNGGSGAIGEDGLTLQNKDKLNCSTTTADGFETTRVDDKIADLENVGRSVSYYSMFRVFGQVGKRGGRGGHGGAPGLGGNAGSIVLIDLLKNDVQSLAKINATNGNTGENGLGGNSGRGGKNGNTTFLLCSPATWLSQNVKPHNVTTNNTYASSGQNGLNGISLKMRQVPKIAPIVQSFPHTINEYKLYARPEVTNISNSDSQLRSFYDSINGRREITKLYDTLSLVEEFTGLEQQGYDLEERHHLIPSFATLQQRIHNYSIKANYDSENSRLFEDIIIGVEDRINDTLRIINKQTGYSVMTDIHKGFEYLLSEVEEFENRRKMNSQLESLNSTLNALDDLTDDAKFLIGNDLHTAMNDLESTLDQEINTVLEEISDLKNTSLQNEKELVESRKKLEDMIVLKGLFGVMKIGCVLVGAVNPALGLVATAAVSSLNVLESQLTQSNFSAQVAEVPKSVKMLSNASENFLKNEEPNKDAIIEIQISQMMRNVSQSGKNVINGMRTRINNFINKPSSEPRLLSYKAYDREGIEKIYLKEEEAITEDLEEALKNKDSTKVNDYKISLNVLKILKVTGEVLQTASDSVTSIMKDVDKINELDIALKKSSDNLMKLYKVEEKIYNEAQPLLNKVMDFVDQAYNKIDEMNENHIIIAQWNVENTIENVQHTLRKTFDGFNVTDEINWTLQKLLSTFQKVSKMHKNILDYQNRKSDAKFSTMLQLTKYSKILAQDHHLTSALVQLEMAIWYNKVNDIYKNWIFAFKQFTFPNGGEILKAVGWKDPIHKDIDSVVDAIVSNVAKFKKFLKEDKNSDELLNNRAPRSLGGSCSSDESSFFVWSNENSRSSIDNILSGKEETIVAFSPTSDVNALKFNKVGIVFTSTNPETQRQLFEIMKTIRVNLTHHGDSYYRFNNKTYEIKTNPTVLTFNYPRTCDEIMRLPSLLYTKIAKGECMLSPFATWTIKLFVDKNKRFPALDQFMGKVDLELIGEGTVFESTECNKECEATMMNNYKYGYEIYH